ncbi:MAG TPA: FAD-dependent oxidoreductase, partial [Solirubrobacteraceae bacterium]|nr:FAD-dependent oxidoreductase [Solirubrobacteraceae bacterium]
TVLGGGAVGCELAQAWALLGATVTLVEAQPALLADEEPFAGEALAEALRANGVELRLGTDATAVARSNDGAFTLTLADGQDEITSDELLVAVGRTPHTGDLGLETIDLEPEATISVDDHMRVRGRDWLYAIGDVNGRALLTHTGKYQAMVAVANIMNREATARWDGALSPRVVFTDPQIAAAGQTLREALDAGIPARSVDAGMDDTPGASFIGKGAPSPCRIVVDEQREVMIGATFTGPGVAESLHAATIAIAGEVPLGRLVHAMPAFPTRSEVWLRLLDPWMP